MFIVTDGLLLLYFLNSAMPEERSGENDSFAGLLYRGPS